uniref:ATP-binding cassette domain-containing protein n=1 Tax=Fervidicoccus fontis TaxID=683846 RepID=A0A7J3ZMR5_9CREN
MLFVKVCNLAKRFGKGVTVNYIGFTVEREGVFDLTEPNTAGKTATLRILAILKPTSDTVEIGNVGAVSDPPGTGRMLSYLPKDAGAYSHTNCREYLRT